MSTRRTFFGQALAGGAMVMHGSIPLVRRAGTTGAPVVVSTWNFGRAANLGAWEVLRKGGRALDAVEQGVRIPEADPEIQTIGYGGLPDRDGRVTLDAAIMDDQYNCGSVMCLEYIMHPISVGLAFKMHGRVGDSPVIGAGLYVDNEVGAATATGVGEEVIRICGSHLIVELMRQGASPEAACKEAVERIVKRSPAKAKDIQVGFLALNKQGEYGAWCLAKGFSYAVKSDREERLIDGKSKY